MTNVRLLLVPYDAGHEGQRMGAGPDHLHLGVVAALQARGHIVDSVRVDAPPGFRAEIRTAFALHRALARQVRQAVDHGSFPLVLSGNCNSALGTLSGLGMPEVGMIWFDGHADCATPETTTTGSLDGMGVSTATGRCWSSLTATIPGYSPLPDSHVVHVGVRHLDAEAHPVLTHSAIAVIDAAATQQGGLEAHLERALGHMRQEMLRGVYVHIDLDVLDPKRWPANGVAVPDGLTLDQVLVAIAIIGDQVPILGGSLTSYDPALDRSGEVQDAAILLAAKLIASRH